jgi:hypothetical protein
VVAVLAEDLAHRFPDDRVVVDDEDIRAGSHGRGVCTRSATPAPDGMRKKLATCV